MIFSRMLAAIHSHRSKMHELSFNKELSEGNLSRKHFEAFIKQDKFYLAQFAKTLKFISFRLSDPKHKQIFDDVSEYVSKTELNLHRKYSSPQKVHQFFSAMTEESHKILPEVLTYVKHLRETACHVHVGCAVASAIPCFYLYSELGKCMQQKGVNEHNPYRHWIASYSSTRFLLNGEQLIKIVNELGSQLNAKEEEEMIAAFVKSTELEIGFWDSVYESEKVTTKSDQINFFNFPKL